jgi:hypothetical protein
VSYQQKKKKKKISLSPLSVSHQNTSKSSLSENTAANPKSISFKLCLQSRTRLSSFLELFFLKKKRKMKSKKKTNDVSMTDFQAMQIIHSAAQLSPQNSRLNFRQRTSTLHCVA